MPSNNPSTHDDRIAITQILEALSTGRASFTTLAVIIADVTPGGGRYAEYASNDEITADIANLNTIAQKIGTVAFAQTERRPEKIILIGADISGVETYVDGLDAAIAAGANFYGVAIDSRTPADQIAVSNDIESKASSGSKYLFFMQDGDADWLTTGIPAAFSTIEDNERTVVYYHDDNTNDATSDRLDIAHAAARLAWDPDLYAAGWNARVNEVDALTTGLTQTQKAFARANYANTALPFGTLTDTYVDPGETLAGRPVDHIVSADWDYYRLREKLADLFVSRGAKGLKVTVDETGQGLIANVIESHWAEGVDIGHFNDFRLTRHAITDADRAARQIRFTGEIQWETGAVQVPITTYFDRDPLPAAA